MANYVFPRIVHQNQDPITKYIAEEDPTLQQDDETQNYVVGQPWVNLDWKDYWVCLRNEENNCRWVRLGELVEIVDYYYTKSKIRYNNKIIYCETTEQVYYCNGNEWILLSWEITQVENYEDLPPLSPSDLISFQRYHKRLGFVSNDKKLYYSTGVEWIQITLSYSTVQGYFASCGGTTEIIHKLSEDTDDDVGFCGITSITHPSGVKELPGPNESILNGVNHWLVGELDNTKFTVRNMSIHQNVFMSLIVPKMGNGGSYVVVTDATYGYLIIYITVNQFIPQFAIDTGLTHPIFDGAAWRPLETTTWRSSGYRYHGLSPGDLEIEFQEEFPYTKPNNKIKKIPECGSETGCGQYCLTVLNVKIMPEFIEDPESHPWMIQTAAWRVNTKTWRSKTIVIDSNKWQPSRSVFIQPGSHIVSFRPVYRFRPVSNKDIDLDKCESLNLPPVVYQVCHTDLKITVDSASYSDDRSDVSAPDFSHDENWHIRTPDLPIQEDGNIISSPTPWFKSGHTVWAGNWNSTTGQTSNVTYTIRFNNNEDDQNPWNSPVDTDVTAIACVTTTHNGRYCLASVKVKFTGEYGSNDPKWSLSGSGVSFYNKSKESITPTNLSSDAIVLVKFSSNTSTSRSLTITFTEEFEGGLYFTQTSSPINFSLDRCEQYRKTIEYEMCETNIIVNSNIGNNYKFTMSPADRNGETGPFNYGTTVPVMPDTEYTFIAGDGPSSMAIKPNDKKYTSGWCDQMTITAIYGGQSPFLYAPQTNDGYMCIWDTDTRTKVETHSLLPYVGWSRTAVSSGDDCCYVTTTTFGHRAFAKVHRTEGVKWIKFFDPYGNIGQYNHIDLGNDLNWGTNPKSVAVNSDGSKIFVGFYGHKDTGAAKIIQFNRNGNDVHTLEIPNTGQRNFHPYGMLCIGNTLYATCTRPWRWDIGGPKPVYGLMSFDISSGITIKNVQIFDHIWSDNNHGMYNLCYDNTTNILYVSGFGTVQKINPSNLSILGGGRTYPEYKTWLRGMIVRGNHLYVAIGQVYNGLLELNKNTLAVERHIEGLTGCTGVGLTLRNEIWALGLEHGPILIIEPNGTVRSINARNYSYMYSDFIGITSPSPAYWSP